MVMKKLILFAFISISLFLLSGCDEQILIPENSEIEQELIGVWALVEADELMEGDLVIDRNGTGTEYGVYGRDIIEQKYDFSLIDYSLEEDKLLFSNRIYKRNPTEKKRSPNFIFPDEGIVKIFIVDDSLPFVVKVGYNSTLDLFFKKLSIWSPQFGYEIDTLWYRVEDRKICRAYVNNPLDSTTTEILPGLGDPKNFNDPFFGSIWHTVYDTSFASGKYNIVYKGPAVISTTGIPDINEGYSSAQNSYLKRFRGYFWVSSFVVDSIGTIYAEWKYPVDQGWNSPDDPGDIPIFHHVVSLEVFYNPLDGYDAGYNGGGR